MASQMSQSSQMDHSVLQMDNQDIERMVAEVVQYFLIMEQKKFPVRKQDITKLLNLKGNSMKTFKSVLTASDKYLEDVFGYKITEFEEKSGHYILVNRVSQQSTLFSKQFSDDNTILFLILSSIFLSEGQIVEDEMWNMLNILGYKSEECKKLVSCDFVKQLYVNTELIPLSDPPKLNYLWGERASIEFTKLEILDFASKVSLIVVRYYIVTLYSLLLIRSDLWNFTRQLWYVVYRSLKRKE